MSGCNKLMTVDGNSIMNRAFYGIQSASMLSTRNGFYTNAVYGFLRILIKYMEEEKPDALCVAFDTPKPTFRHEKFDTYKGKRKEMPPELAAQFPVIKDVLKAMNVRIVEIEGFEADDIIGTLSLMSEESETDCVIVTGDKDSFQLASDRVRIKIPITRGGKTETDEYDRDAIMEKFKLQPAQMIDVKSLMGDTSDNIPGVPGVGEKTALELIQNFGSLDNVYASIDSITKPALKQKLADNRELAYTSRMLAEIDRHVPIGFEDICELRLGEYDDEALLEIFQKLEFRSLIEKFGLTGKAPVKPASEMIEPYMMHQIKTDDELNDLVNKVRSAGRFAFWYSADEHMLSIAPNGADAAYAADISDAVGAGTLLDLFTDEKIAKSGFDVKNFAVFLKDGSRELNGLACDIMIAAYIISPSESYYDIGELSERYISKTLADRTPGSLLAAMVQLEPVLEGIIKDNGQWDLYSNIELPLVLVLSEIEHNGFKVDRDVLLQMTAELDDLIRSIETQIYMMAGEEFNIGSPKKLSEILYEKLALPAGKKTKTGRSTNSDALENIYHLHPIIPKIMDYRQYTKLRSTYTDGLLKYIGESDGKIHTRFNQTVTVTGRLSSTEPNLQNIPVKLDMGRRARKAFVPSGDEFVLVAADYSQIELRILAHLASDEMMINDFRNGVDIHASTASRVFGVPPEMVTARMRNNAKAVNFGIVYGISDYSLSNDIGVSVKEARAYIEEYFEKYSGVKAYMKNTVEQCRAAGFVTTLLNRRRYFPEINSSNYNIRMFNERAAINTTVQGSAADIIKIAMVRVYERMMQMKLKSRLILQVHDELIAEAYKPEAETVKEIFASCMENAYRLSVPLKVSISEGDSWYDAK